MKNNRIAIKKIIKMNLFWSFLQANRKYNRYKNIHIHMKISHKIIKVGKVGKYKRVTAQCMIDYR